MSYKTRARKRAIRRAQAMSGGRRKVDPATPPRLAEVEVDELARENRERQETLTEQRRRFGPLRGDVRP